MFRALFNRLRHLVTTQPRRTMQAISPMEGHSLPWQDTLAAIADLKELADEETGSFAVHLALGNLYRAQGDIDRALEIRHNLLHRPDISPEHRGRILLELGRDYKRSGLLDRAQDIFDQTRELIGPDPVLLEEMAALAAAGRDYEQAAHLYAQVKKPVAQAHYMVEQARTWAQAGQNDRSQWLLRKALKVYPGSVEAWTQLMILAYESLAWPQLHRSFAQGLKAVDPRLRFLLLEGLIQHLFTQRTPHDLFSPVLTSEAGQTLIQVIAAQDPDVHLFYYKAWIHLQLGETQAAQKQLRACGDMDPDFWPARLELFALYADDEPLSPESREQFDYILLRGRQVKKFVCSRCGLKLDQVFFLCPKCRSWHSIAFLKFLDT